MVFALVAGTSLLAGAAICAVQTSVTRRRNEIAAPVSTPLAVNPAPVADRQIVRIAHGRMEIDSVDAWLAFSGPAMTDALRRGMRTPSEVMAYVMRMALPRYPWPPPASSTLQPQWKHMVADVAELLRFDPEPEPRTRLHVVK